MTIEQQASIAVGICRELEKQCADAADRHIILWLALGSALGIESNIKVTMTHRLWIELGFELNIDLATIHEPSKRPLRGEHNV